MSKDLGIRAAVRAAVERESDLWFTRLNGFLGTNDDWRGTPYWACTANRPVTGDMRDGCRMRDYTAHPEWRALEAGA
jgi:hypothetical protein